MTRLSISLLGPPQLTLNGAPVEGLAFQKARALLAYLVMESPTQLSREQLVTLLWPDEPESVARTNLRQALATVRRAIADDRAEPPFLKVNRESIGFRLSADDQLDTNVFTALIRACEVHKHRHSDRCRSCAWRREQAVELYRGEFLAGFHLRDADPFDEWAALRREHLHRKMVDALARLASYHQARGDLERAESFVSRALELDPWMEEAHRDRIRLLALSGKRSQALAQYKACQQVLAEALGVDPSDETQQLYQRVKDGLLTPDDAPPRPSSRLPRPSTRFVGREAELGQLAELLEDPDHRLVTITGVGGVGKSRLALAAAEALVGSFVDGTVYIPTTTLDSADQLPGLILTELNKNPTTGTRQQFQAIEELYALECLLILDGYEHLLPGGLEFIRHVLEQASRVSVLVTSQERLGLQSEWRIELPGLPLPESDDPEAASISAAVQLFRERLAGLGREPREAQTPDILRICRAVEGVPLAIELAASSADASGLNAVAASLESGVEILHTRYVDVPERQRSPEAAFEYSWHLLEPQRQADLRRLSVFRGGWDTDSARQVAGVEPQGLIILTDKSLIRRDPSGRFSFHPLLQSLAWAKLEQSGEAADLQSAHLNAFVDLAKTAAENLAGAEQVEWLGRFDLDLANFRHALAWALDHGESDQAARLCLSLARFWMIRGYLKEGQGWVERALASDPAPSDEDRARLHNRAGILAAMQRRFEQAEAHLENSVELNRKLGNRRGEVTSLNSLGAMSIEREQYDRALQYLEECVPAWRELEDINGMASSLNNLGVVALMTGDRELATSRFEEAVQLFRDLGDRRMIAGVLYNLGDLALKASDTDLARDRFRESLSLRQQIGEIGGVAEALEGLAMALILDQQGQTAAQLLGAASAIRKQLELPLAPVNQEQYERAVADARQQLGDRGYESAFASGVGLSAEQAIELARER